MDSTSATLLHRLRQPADRMAWDSFVRLYTPLLFYWARRTGLAEADAADLVQDVFCVMIRKLPDFEYDRGKSFRAWLKTVLQNTWRNRARQRSLPTLGGDKGPVLEAVDEDDAIRLEETEYRDHLVARAVELMQTEFEPATWQACWQLVVEGRPAAEVARQLDLSINAVYLAKSRVLARLRRELAGLLD
jgi:RNA polymerase sigma-70 factor (ECF subfamily)